MDNNQPVRKQMSDAEKEKLSEIAEGLNALWPEMMKALLSSVEAASKAITGFMRAFSPAFVDVLTQIGERDERKERSRKKYERMYARGKPRVRKSRRRW